MKYDKFITEQGDNGYLDRAEHPQILEIVCGLSHTVNNDYNAYALTFKLNAEGEIVEQWGLEPVFTDFNKPKEQAYYLELCIIGQEDYDYITLEFSDEFDRDDIAEILFADDMDFTKYGRREVI